MPILKFRTDAISSALTVSSPMPEAESAAAGRKISSGEITGMAKNGYREIVLTGIHISSYGIDFDEEAWKRGESVSVLKGRRGEKRLFRQQQAGRSVGTDPRH